RGTPFPYTTLFRSVRYTSNVRDASNPSMPRISMNFPLSLIYLTSSVLQMNTRNKFYIMIQCLLAPVQSGYSSDFHSPEHLLPFWGWRFQKSLHQFPKLLN